MRQPTRQTLALPRVRHIRQVITHNRVHQVPSSIGKLLHNVPQIIHNERERLATLRDRAEQAVDLAHDIVQQPRHAVHGVDEDGVEVQRGEDAVHDADQVAQPHDELEVDVDVGDGEIDLLDADGDARVYRDERVADGGVQVDVGLELLDDELDLAHGKRGDVEEDVGGGSGRAAV